MGMIYRATQGCMYCDGVCTKECIEESNNLIRKMNNKGFQGSVNVHFELNDKNGLDFKLFHTENITIEEAAKVLVGGISLIIKSVNQKEGIRDYELMKEVIDLLNHEFTSITSFQDATLIYKKQNKNE